jgi:NAD(P)-dependent dehydrogenase (short-subunit alcohol dehydrogenase family)
MVSQVWLITGSSRGLGRAFAEAALASGLQVAATARNTEDLAELKDKYGDLVLPLSLDVTSETQASEAVKATIRTFGKLDVLVNNAGYGNVAPIEDTTLEDFRAQIETNLFGVIILTKAVLPYFRERGSGHIIQVTSIAGRIGPIGRAPYAAAKWGVEGFSETLAKKWDPSASRSPSSNQVVSGRTSQGRQPICGKDVPNTMRRSVRQRASSATTTESNPATRPGLQPHC